MPGMNPLRVPGRPLRTGLAGALLLGLCACAQPAGSASADHEPQDGSTAPAPAAPGLVTAVATVLQENDDPPELCLGGVAESFPPQCGGPEITGWDWNAVEADSAQGTIWGEYTVKGTWDGETFRLTEAASAPTDPTALADDPRLDPDNAGAVGRDLSESETQELQDEVLTDLGGLGGWSENGYVWVTVAYDDGSIQSYADDTYGADRVAVQSALRDVE